MSSGYLRTAPSSIASILRSSSKVCDLAPEQRNAMFAWLQERDLLSDWIMQATTMSEVRKLVADRGVELPRP